MDTRTSKKVKTVTIRPRPEDLEIIARIREAESREGLEITITDAMRIALASWQREHNRLYAAIKQEA